MEKKLVVFNSTHHAIFCEDILNQLNIEYNMIPTPRKIESSCGLSIEIYTNNLVEIKEVIDQNKISIMGIFDKINGKYIKYD